MNNPYAPSAYGNVAALANVTERTDFIRKTYLHLAGAVIGFVLLEAVIINTVGPVLLEMMGKFRWAPMILMFGFMAVGWLARSWAESETSQQLQYVGLSLYVLAEAVIMAPLLLFATAVDDQIPAMAGVVTGVVFAGLTAFTFMTRADFSWMGRILWIVGLGALGFAICAMVFQQSSWLGMGFSVAMVVLAAGYILYDTSNVLHHYRTSQHVAASLALFASVALMFWYVVRIFIAMREE